jgi:hypothetical protein
MGELSARNITYDMGHKGNLRGERISLLYIYKTNEQRRLNPLAARHSVLDPLKVDLF